MCYAMPMSTERFVVRTGALLLEWQLQQTHPLKQSGPVILLYGGSIPYAVSEEKSTPSDMP